MIRALHEKLAIPPELLIREPAAEYGGNEDVEASDVPTDLLVKRGWVQRGESVAELLKRFMAPAGAADSPGHRGGPRTV